MSEQSLESMKQAFFNPSHEQPEAPVEETHTETKEEVVADAEEHVEEKSNKELENYKKRFQDTQKSFHNAYNTTKEIVDKALENGWMSEEEAKEALGKAKSNDLSVEENPFAEIDAKFTTEAPIVAGALGMSEEDMMKYTEAFNQMSKIDPSVEKELVAVAPSQMTKWILDKGKEFTEVSPMLEEHGGALGAIRALSNQKPDIDALREEIKAQIMAELETGTPKANISKTGTTSPTAPQQGTLSLNEMKKNFFK